MNWLLCKYWIEVCIAQRPTFCRYPGCNGDGCRKVASIERGLGAKRTPLTHIAKSLQCRDPQISTFAEKLCIVIVPLLLPCCRIMQCPLSTVLLKHNISLHNLFKLEDNSLLGVQQFCSVEGDVLTKKMQSHTSYLSQAPLCGKSVTGRNSVMWRNSVM